MRENPRTILPCAPSRVGGFLLLACFFVGLSGIALAAPPNQNLVPANLNPRPDGGGFNWDIDQRGMVNDGTNDCFDGGILLTVNGAEFNSPQPMMTADGRELVLTAVMGNLEVTRRIRVDAKAAGARYVETFRNTGSSAATVTADIRAQFGGQCQMVISDTAAPNPVALGAAEGGIIGVQNPGGRPSVMFLLADPKSKLKPSVTVNQNYVFNFNYPLNIPAGRTISIAHTVVQIHLGGTPDAKTLAGMIKPYRARQWLADLPSEVRRTIANASRGGYSGGGDAPELLAHLDRLGVARGTADILAVGEETRLQGNASCAGLTIETRYGSVKIAFEDVAALVGGKHSGPSTEVYLRDGQVLRGKVTAEKLRFTMSSGLGMDLKIETLDRLVTQTSPADGKPNAEVYALVETFDGDRLSLVRGSSARLEAQTPWGPRDVALDELLWLRLPGEDQPGHVIGLADGSRFFAYLPNTPLAVKTRLFGEQEFAPNEISSILAVSEKPSDEVEEADDSQPQVVLAGGNLLIGRIDVPELHFVTAGAVVPVPPDQIRTMHNQSEESDALSSGSATFYAEVWGGGTVQGQLQEVVVPVRLADRVVQVPVRDIVDVTVPVPTVPESLRDQIAALIRDLGNPEWEIREAASRDLGELGYLAKSQLTEANRQATDPEVTRRLRGLLDTLKD